MNYKGYIFDLDDTLFCEHDYVRSGFYAVAKEISKLSKNIQVNHINQLLVEEWMENGRGKVFDEVCKKLKVTCEIRELVSVYRNHEPNIELYQDAVQIINHLIDQKKKLAIITDGHSKMQWAKIDALFLRKWFQCIVVTGDLGDKYWKPHEFPYVKTVACLGLNFNECVYIGDNPHKDFITAKKLGIGTIRIVRPIGDYQRAKLPKAFEADQTITSLDELIDKRKS